MKVEVENYKITLTPDEAVALCKILGSLSPDDIKKLKGCMYTCGDKENEVSEVIYKKLSDSLLNGKTYREVFMSIKE